MSRNGSGSYSLPQPPFVPGTVISSSAVNSDFSDIATALTQSVAYDGQTVIIGALRSNLTGTPAYSSSLDNTTGFGVSTAGEADIWASGTKIIQVTTAGVTLNAPINLTTLNLTSVQGGVSVSVTSATPGVVTWIAHGFSANQPVYFTAATIPAGLVANETYYVVGASITTNTFEIATTPGGSAVNTTSTGTSVLGFTPALSVIGGTSIQGGTTTDNLTVTGVLNDISTGYWIPPTGTTGQRPGTVSAGWERFNSTLNTPEFFDGAVWRQPIFTPPTISSRNLVIKYDSTTPNTVTDVSADSVIVATSSFTYYQVTGVSLTMNIAANWGGGGNLDTGSVAASTWYAIWIIYDPATATVNAIYSLSSTSPTLPTGYTASGRFGWVRTDGSSHLLRTIQQGSKAQYVIGTNPAVAPNIAVGPAGTSGNVSPILASASVTTVVPTTATAITVLGTVTYQGNGGTGQLLVAPNTSWGGTNNGPSGANGQIYPIAFISAGTETPNVTALIRLEGSTLGWVGQSSGNAISCLGWEDVV